MRHPAGRLRKLPTGLDRSHPDDCNAGVTVGTGFLLPFLLFSSGAAEMGNRRRESGGFSRGIISLSPRRSSGGRRGTGMTELEQILAGDGAAAAPEAILEGLDEAAAHRAIEGAPRTIYQELWHIAFWQELSLDWIRGFESPFPDHPGDGFPAQADRAREDWEQLRQRFFEGNRQSAEAARDRNRLEQPIRCPSRPGLPVRTMTVREQLENMAAHNAYHFGRIVLLRQLIGAWPPRSGGYSW